MTVGIWEGGYWDSEELIETLQGQASLFSSPTADWLSMVATRWPWKPLGVPKLPEMVAVWTLTWSAKTLPLPHPTMVTKRDNKKKKK